MNINTQYKILVGQWINTNTPVLVAIGSEKKVKDNTILIETYILIPKDKPELINDKPPRTTFPCGLGDSDPEGFMLDSIKMATSHIESELGKAIPQNLRDFHADLFPYKLREIELNQLISYYKNSGPEFRSCLAKIKDDTQCCILRDLLKSIREL